MFAILNLVIPIFIIIGIGYFAIARHILSQTALRGMGRFVVTFALPALIFQAIISQPIGAIMNPVYFLGYAGGSLISFFIGFAIAKLRRQTSVAAVVNGLGQSASNTGFIGYPLLLTLIGEKAGIFFSLNVLVENLLILPLFLILGDSFAAKGGKRWQLIKTILGNLLKNPMILAMLAGLLCALFGLGDSLPYALKKAVNMLANAGGAIALFVIGGSLVGLKIRGSMPDIIQITLGKLIIMPLAVFALLRLFGAGGDVMLAGVLLAGAPMASMYPLMGARYGHQRRAAAALLATTVLSLLSTSTIIYCFQHLVPQ